jgi:hypothetical protein
MERARIANMTGINRDEFRILFTMAKILDPVARKEILELDNPTLLDIRTVFDNLKRVRLLSNKLTATPLVTTQQQYNFYKVNNIRRDRQDRSRDKGTKVHVNCYRFWQAGS